MGYGGFNHGMSARGLHYNSSVVPVTNSLYARNGVPVTIRLGRDEAYPLLLPNGRLSGSWGSPETRSARPGVQ